jgi:protein-S-isoprenylcysteine O-methyltransferase Ste14
MTGSPVDSRKLVATALSLLLWPALVPFLAGDWRWAEGWLFGGWFLALCTNCIAWLYFKDPALLAERYRKPGSGGQKGWDTLVVYGLTAGFIAWLVIMPLDAKRFRWTPRVPVGLKMGGGVMLLLSSLLIFRSFADNTFLSPLVRIQTERKQRVVSTGVYGFVRHPMYLGAILMFTGAPLLLGSAGGLLLGVAIGALLGARIEGEEKLLASGLEGYEEYRKRVRFRLVPFIW